MASKHYKPEEIVAKLRQVEVLVGQGGFGAWMGSDGLSLTQRLLSLHAVQA